MKTRYKVLIGIVLVIAAAYFWFTRDTPPAFFAFEGALGNGVEVVMTPETPATKTAQMK